MAPLAAVPQGAMFLQFPKEPWLIWEQLFYPFNKHFICDFRYFILIIVNNR